MLLKMEETTQIVGRLSRSLPYCSKMSGCMYLSFYKKWNGKWNSFTFNCSSPIFLCGVKYIYHLY